MFSRVEPCKRLTEPLNATWRYAERNHTGEVSVRIPDLRLTVGYWVNVCYFEDRSFPVSTDQTKGNSPNKFVERLLLPESPVLVSARTGILWFHRPFFRSYRQFLGLCFPLATTTLFQTPFSVHHAPAILSSALHSLSYDGAVKWTLQMTVCLSDQTAW
jgi:hypothetical protein